MRILAATLLALSFAAAACGGKSKSSNTTPGDNTNGGATYGKTGGDPCGDPCGAGAKGDPCGEGAKADPCGGDE